LIIMSGGGVVSNWLTCPCT